MGTRSLTFVYDEDGRTIISMYRQYDGYPSGHGKELAEFLEPITMVNGIGMTPDGTVIANGPGCLAAQMVAHFKDGPGGIYINPTTAVDCGQDYEYHIATHGEGVGLTITCHRIEDLRPFRRKKIFDGSIEEFKAFCEKEDA